MITLKELNPNGYPLTKVQEDNLSRLFYAMNEIRKQYGKPMIVTSGVRSLEDQTRIDACRIVGGKKAGPRLGSAHLQAAACDVWDREGTLWRFVRDNLKLMEQLGVYLEDRSKTPTWCHFQILRPKSGNRIFLP